MRILFIVAALFTLAGCESMEFVAVDYHNGHSYSPYFQTVGYTSYTLGYYSGSYYNGYRVYGNHGYRYYHAPHNYSHHRTFVRPVVVQHVHVHTSYCEHTVRPRHNDRQRDNHRSDYVQPQVRNNPRATPPRSTPPRRTPPTVTPPRQRTPQAQPPKNREQRADRSERREDRGNRRRNQEKKRK